MHNDHPDELLKTKQAAMELGVHVRTIGRWIDDGTITPAITVPGQKGTRLFTRAEVDRVKNLRAAHAA